MPGRVALGNHVHLSRNRICGDADESAIGRPDIAELGRKDDLVSMSLDGLTNQLLIPTQSMKSAVSRKVTPSSMAR